MKRLDKLFLTICISTICFTANGQQYDEVVISDWKKPDADNQIFKPGTVLTYSIETDTILDLPAQLDYTVLSLPKSKRTNKTQTEVVISFSSDQNRFENTGVVDNASNVWMHPPRTGLMKVLETCPFPYVKFPLAEGTTWDDQISIGEQWSLGLWKGRMLFEVSYEVTGKRQFEVDNIKYDCWVIEATAQSEAGTTKLEAIYHEEDGFMELNYSTLSESQITLKLTSIVQGQVFGSMKEYYAAKMNR